MSAAIPHLDSVRCCDCLDGLRDLPDGCIDLVVTDPPYSYVTNRGGGCFGSDRRGYHMELEPISHGFVREVNEELLRVMRAPNIYIWCSRDQIRDTIDWWMDNADVGMDVLTWHKTNPVPTCNNKYLSDTEYLLFFRGKGVRVNGSYDTKRKFYVSGVNKADKDLYNHPTAILCGMALITLLNPGLGLILAIIALIILGAKGNVYLGGQALLGWLFGIIVMIASVMVAVAVGIVVIA